MAQIRSFRDFVRGSAGSVVRYNFLMEDPGLFQVIGSTNFKNLIVRLTSIYDGSFEPQVPRPHMGSSFDWDAGHTRDLREHLSKCAVRVNTPVPDDSSSFNITVNSDSERMFHVSQEVVEMLQQVVKHRLGGNRVRGFSDANLSSHFDHYTAFVRRVDPLFFPLGRRVEDGTQTFKERKVMVV